MRRPAPTGNLSVNQNREHLYISTTDELVAFCERVSKARVLAVDTEFLREKTYHPRLCLVQVASKDECAAIDPLLIDDLGPLVRLLEDESVTKVFHASSQDLEVLYDGLGCVTSPVFDTQLAAAFLGLRQQMSYGALVEAYTGIHLAKAEALTDWSRRPLDPEQLTYAEDDVRYLPGIYERMVARLVECDRLSWVLPEMDALTDRSRLVRDPSEAYLRLKRSSTLTRRQLAIAREVCAWRELSASRRDLPRKWVLTDEVIVEICRRAPGDEDRLRRVRGAEQLSQRDCDEILAAVGRGCSVAPEDCPRLERHARPSGEVEGVVDLMYALIRVVAEKEGVASQLVATREDLFDFVWNPSSSRLSSGWRHEVVGDLLSRLLSGEIGLTVKDGRIELL